MVVLNRIYTRTGDKGLTRLASGDLRLHAVHVAALWSAAARIALGDIPGTEMLRERLRPIFAANSEPRPPAPVAK